MTGRRGRDGFGDPNRVAAIAEALREETFDPQHTGTLYLREAASSAIFRALPGAVDVVAGIEGKAELPGARFMGIRVTPDVAVYSAGAAPKPPDTSAPLDLFAVGARTPRDDGTGGIAVTITILRQDARPVQEAIANAVILATRYEAVVVFVLDRRMSRRDPFGAGDRDDASPLSSGDRWLVQSLAEDHGITVVVRRQDPFGFA
jgi:hypothetical protein